MNCNCPVSQPPGPTLASTCGGSSFMLFMGLLEVFIRSQCDLEDPCGRPTSRRRPDVEYDFVVVGGGSAGSVVAARLSEIPHWNVLLIEAGLDEPTGAQVPSMFLNFIGSSIDWNFRTEPEEMACLNENERRCSWPRGKVLGGTSVLNGMMYMRGSRKDYDEWAAFGNPGWGYQEVLPYFLKSEDNLQAHLMDPGYHGVGGYLTVTQFPYHPPLSHSILQAGRELGFQVRDLNGAFHTGFAIAQTTSRNGSRLSTAKAFLRPNRNRPNLHIMLNTTVTRVLINESSREAYGVEVIRGDTGRRDRIFARSEVSDPVRRRCQLAAAAAAVGRGPGGGAARRGRPAGAPSAGRGPQPAQPRRLLRQLLHQRHGHAGAQLGHRHGVPALPRRAHVRHRHLGGHRLRQLALRQPLRRQPRPAVLLWRVPRQLRAHRTGGRARFGGRQRHGADALDPDHPGVPAPQEPRRAAPAQCRPAGGAGHQRALPHTPGRRGCARRRHPLRHPAVRDAGAAALRLPAGPHARARLRELHVRLRRVLGVRRAPADGAREPPGGLVPHGPPGRRRRRRRRAAARARRGQAARRRRLRHAQGHLGQHQRAHRHDRREGRRHDQDALARQADVALLVLRTATSAATSVLLSRRLRVHYVT